MFSREGCTERLCSSLDSNRIAIAAMNESTAAGTVALVTGLEVHATSKATWTPKKASAEIYQRSGSIDHISRHVILTGLMRRDRDGSVFLGAFKSFIMRAGVQSRNNAAGRTERIDCSKNDVKSKSDRHPLTTTPKTLSFEGWHEAAMAAGKQRCL